MSTPDKNLCGDGGEYGVSTAAAHAPAAAKARDSGGSLLTTYQLAN